MSKEKQIYVVDSQILSTISACQRKTHFTFDMNLEPIIKPDYFEKGSLVHTMLAAYYKLRKHRQRWSLNNKTHADIVDICVKIGKISAIKMSLDTETVDEVEQTVREYCSHTNADGWDQVLSVEEVASKILYEDDDMIILYQGQIDLTIAISNSTLLPVDHKSGSRRGKPEYLSNQFQGYCWLLGVNNIIVNKVGFQKTLKPEEKFERHTLSYPPDLLEEWREQAIYYIKKYISDSEVGFYPQNYTSCDKYSGCIFESVCRRSKEMREYKLSQMFSERPKWDVGKEKEN